MKVYLVCVSLRHRNGSCGRHVCVVRDNEAAAKDDALSMQRGFELAMRGRIGMPTGKGIEDTGMSVADVMSELGIEAAEYSVEVREVSGVIETLEPGKVVLA
jgi:hypothetical protein